MPNRAFATCLELRVATFELALRAASVLAVLQDVPCATTLPWRDRPLPFVDLACALAHVPPRARVPFALTVESDLGCVAIGVDRVGHVQAGPNTELATLPHFGLQQPQLFDGAVRLGGRLLLVLDSEALARFVQTHADAAFA